jgi:hypothetical protein
MFPRCHIAFGNFCHSGTLGAAAQRYLGTRGPWPVTRELCLVGRSGDRQEWLPSGGPPTPGVQRTVK